MSLGFIVLYEDQRAQTTSFGLHELVVACVADRAALARHSVAERLKGIPKKGAGNLLKACTRDVEQLCNRGRVHAVFDCDKIRAPLNLPKDATDREVRAALEKRCGRREGLRFHLLDQNLESVLVALDQCSNVDREQLSRALAKDLIDRDLLFGSVASMSDPHVRDCIQERMPSFKDLIDALFEAW